MKLIITILTLYKKFITPFLVGILGYGCRDNPTCTEYTRKAIGKFGIIKGGRLGFIRLLRCHPLSNHHYFDPLPESLN